ncbi:MAG: Tfp pilus assembly protein FimT/FimU [Clostridia bacterium]
MLKEKGITLMALCVTIVVLLILAGVAIQTIVGEDSIVHQVKQEKKNVETKQNMEQSYINSLEEELKKEKNTI